MGCGNELDDKDDKALEKSANGENCEPVPNLLELPAPESTPALPQPETPTPALPLRLENTPSIEEELEKGEERWDRAESLGINPENILEPEVACGDTKELIANADPNTVIISHGPRVPIFATDFRDSGQKLSKRIPDYPKDYPEVKVYTPVFPTKENLKKMLQGYNPISPWGEKVNLHHYQQEAKGPLMMMEASQHQGFSGVIHEKGKGLSREERIRYNEIERPNIWKMAAKTYLGENLTKIFEEIILEEEENE